MESIAVKRALLSVSDKTGLVEFARALVQNKVEIISTGGTAKTLREAGIPVTLVSDVTGFPEMMDGRVKTLHPAIHGGILADRDTPEHLAAIASQNIAPLDLVCVNLYPFEKTVSRPDVSLADAIENIDIGGPAMVRSAAKNHNGVAVVVDPADYQKIARELSETGAVSLISRQTLAAKAFSHTAAYDGTIASFLEKAYAPETNETADTPAEENMLPQMFRLVLPRVQSLRYGENPHQNAALYRDDTTTEPCIGHAVRRDISDKEVSFNNLYDLDGALELIKEFPDRPAACVIKHANPCGCAQAETLAEAFASARAADTVSAFGGILAVNRPLDAETAAQITGPNTFFECIVAPSYEPGVVETLTTKKKWGANLRLLEVGDLSGGPSKDGFLMKQIGGGVLLSTRDYLPIGANDLTVQSDRHPTPQEITELLFAWRVVKHVKSNAIVLTKNNALVGVGAGQMNRVQSVRLAVEQAGDLTRGAVLASDAFFPFPDGPEAAAKAGVSAIIQPGGSKKDDETIAVCNSYGIALVFTNVRHFRH